jgi:hypothetical protein
MCNMTSCIPSEICEQCCRLCETQLNAIVPIIVEDPAFKKRWGAQRMTSNALIAQSTMYNHYYFSQYNTLRQSNPNMGLRDLADLDLHVWKFFIARNLIAASIVNKCKSCYFHMMNEGEQLFLATEVTVFLIDSESFTLMDINNHVPGPEAVAAHIKNGTLYNLLCVCYDRDMLTTYLDKRIDMRHVFGYNEPLLHSDAIHSFASCNWIKIARFHLEAFNHMLAYVQQHYDPNASVQVLSEIWLSVIKHNLFTNPTIDDFKYAMQYVSRDTFEEHVQDCLHEFERDLSLQRRGLDEELTSLISS